MSNINHEYAKTLMKKEDSLVTEELDGYFLSHEDAVQNNKDKIKQYKKLQENLVLFKEGNREATEYIIKRFHYFISMYAKLICYKYMSYTTTIYTNKKTKEKVYMEKVHPTLRSFMFLYCTKEEREEYKGSPAKLYNNITEKIYLLFNKYSYSDIYNELVLALLNMASKYKITSEGDKYHKENGTFHMYVSKCFHFEAKRFLDKLIEDPIINHSVPLLEDRDDLDIECDVEQHVIADDKAEADFNKMINNASRDIMIRDSDKLVFKEQEEIEYNDIESLNFNWTNGITCSEIFKDLTSLEREIIVLIYIKRMTIKRVSEIYNISRTDINRIRDSAINKLKDILNK